MAPARKGEVCETEGERERETEARRVTGLGSHWRCAELAGASPRAAAGLRRSPSRLEREKDRRGRRPHTPAAGVAPDRPGRPRSHGGLEPGAPRPGARLLLRLLQRLGRGGVRRRGRGRGGLGAVLLAAARALHAGVRARPVGQRRGDRHGVAGARGRGRRGQAARLGRLHRPPGPGRPGLRGDAAAVGRLHGAALPLALRRRAVQAQQLLGAAQHVRQRLLPDGPELRALPGRGPLAGPPRGRGPGARPSRGVGRAGRALAAGRAAGAAGAAAEGHARAAARQPHGVRHGLQQRGGGARARGLLAGRPEPGHHAAGLRAARRPHGRLLLLHRLRREPPLQGRGGARGAPGPPGPPAAAPAAPPGRPGGRVRALLAALPRPQESLRAQLAGARGAAVRRADPDRAPAPLRHLPGLRQQLPQPAALRLPGPPLPRAVPPPPAAAAPAAARPPGPPARLGARARGARGARLVQRQRRQRRQRPHAALGAGLAGHQAVTGGAAGRRGPRGETWAPRGDVGPEGALGRGGSSGPPPDFGTPHLDRGRAGPGDGPRYSSAGVWRYAAQ
ncbi:uncharacterized protein LOC141557651 isoform X1 [Sminthopsis crassicaudata]|uniref:uncharacterized protein LOC141557651 isoform X1 n=1 Tax=Sminthopsis crassicaudata TaxID=9301 RepID=UPI003D68220E